MTRSRSLRRPGLCCGCGVFERPVASIGHVDDSPFSLACANATERVVSSNFGPSVVAMTTSALPHSGSDAQPEPLGAVGGPGDPGATSSHSVTSADPTRMQERPDGVLLPAETYWFGDIGYAVRSEDWADLLDETQTFTAHRVGSIHLRPSTMTVEQQTLLASKSVFDVVAFEARQGRGTYLDSVGHPVAVDTGLVGLLPAWALFLLDDFDQTAIARCGTFHALTSPTLVREEGGTIVFGGHRLNTGDPAALGTCCERCGAYSNLDRSKRNLPKVFTPVRSEGRCARCAAIPERVLVPRP